MRWSTPVPGVVGSLGCNLPGKTSTFGLSLLFFPRTETVSKAELHFGGFVRSIVHIVPGLAPNWGGGGAGGGVCLLSFKWDLNSLYALGWHSACGLNFNSRAYS